MRLKLQRLMKPILSVLVLSGCLVAGEVLLRQVYPVDTGTSAHFSIPDPKLGWILEPGASYWQVLPEAIVQVRYNSEGWRDVERSREKPSSAYPVRSAVKWW